jgi:hypothetical protein
LMVAVCFLIDSCMATISSELSFTFAPTLSISAWSFWAVSLHFS